MPESTVNLREYLFNLWQRIQGHDIDAVLVRGAGGSFVVLVVGAIMAFGSNMLLARLLGVAQYGIYIYSITWIHILALACQLGMNTSLLRFVPTYNSKGEWSLLRGILSRSVQYVLFTNTVVVFVSACVIWVLFERIGDDQAYTLWIALVILPFICLTGLRSAALRAFKHVVKSGLPESLFRPFVIIILSLIFYFVIQEELKATHVMLFNLMGAVVAFFIGSIWLLKVLPEKIRHITSSYAGREWLKVSLPLYFMSGMGLILKQTDIVMLGVILDTEQAGIYAVASRIAGLMVFGLTAANTIVAPMISELYSTGELQVLQRIITKAARGIFIFTLAVGVSLVILGDYILVLFGAEFVAGYTPLLILISGQAINALAGSVGFLMTMTGHQNQAAKILGLYALLNIILNAILISSLGIIGAAIATALTTILRNLTMLVYVWRQLNINPTILARL